MPFIGDQATANAKIKKHVFTATASQTAFTVASNAGDELQVFLNGVLLKLTDDYTYTTSTVTLGSGATVSDIVEVHVYQSFVVADAVKVSGDTMTGELEVPTVKLSSNVIKASDGTTAITTSGANITLAGTTNNIGTVTSGTYNSTIGDSATFPAGHIIQTTPIVSGTTFTSIPASWTSTVVTDSITPDYADSSILVFSNFMHYWDDSSGDAGVSFRIKKVHSGGTSYPTSMDTFVSGGHHSGGYNNLTTGDAGDWNAYVTQDPAVGVADESVSYTIEGYGYNVNGSQSIGGNASNRWWIFLQEVKR